MAEEKELEEAMCAIHLLEQKADIGSDLTPAEERFAAEKEPITGTGKSLRLIDAPGMSQGRQSRVSVLAYNRDHEERRVVWKRMGAGKSLTESEAREMWKRLDHYRAKLINVGWQVPRLLYSAVVPVASNECQIFSYEHYIHGGDAEVMLRNPDQPNFRKWYLVDEILRTLYAYPEGSLKRDVVAGRKVSLLPDGLDLKAANFVLEDGTDQLYFIDLFGPKELTSDGRWMIYTPKIDTLPAENLRAVCATREGTILRFWRLARRLWKLEKKDRIPLTEEFLDHFTRLDPPEEELAFVTGEIESNCPWMDSLYKEHHI
jgi:hypothetical protein